MHYSQTRCKFMYKYSLQIADQKLNKPAILSSWIIHIALLWGTVPSVPIYINKLTIKAELPPTNTIISRCHSRNKIMQIAREVRKFRYFYCHVPCCRNSNFSTVAFWFKISGRKYHLPSHLYSVCIMSPRKEFSKLKVKWSLCAIS